MICDRAARACITALCRAPEPAGCNATLSLISTVVCVIKLCELAYFQDQVRQLSTQAARSSSEVDMEYLKNVVVKYMELANSQVPPVGCANIFRSSRFADAGSAADDDPNSFICTALHSRGLEKSQGSTHKSNRWIDGHLIC